MTEHGHGKCPSYNGVAVLGGQTRGSSRGQFDWPCAVTVMHDGQVVVADAHNHRVQVFDTQLRFVRAIGERGDQTKEFKEPCAVCCGNGKHRDATSGIPMHDLFVVADYGNKRVQVVSVFGDWARIIPCQGGWPYGVCVDSHHASSSGAPNIYVSLGLHRIAVFSWTGEPLYTFGFRGSQPGELYNPHHLCFDQKHDQLIVADCWNHRVQVFSPTGEPLHAFGSQGSGPAQFEYPSAVCLATGGSNQYLAVADMGNDRLCIYTWDGKKERLSTIIGKKGKEPREFYGLRDVCADTHGRLLVADSDNNRIQVIPPATDSRVALVACCFSEFLQERLRIIKAIKFPYSFDEENQ